MTQIPPDALQQGVLIALDRDRARRVFGARELSALQEAVRDLLGDESLWQQQLAMVLEHRGSTIQQALNSCPLTDPDSRPALAQTLTGGRPLADDAPWHVYVVRPDMVGHIAEALTQVDAEQFEQTVVAGNSDTNGTRAIELFGRIQAFYERAVEARSAVAYCAGE